MSCDHLTMKIRIRLGLDLGVALQTLHKLNYIILYPWPSVDQCLPIRTGFHAVPQVLVSCLRSFLEVTRRYSFGDRPQVCHLWWGRICHPRSTRCPGTGSWRRCFQRFSSCTMRKFSASTYVFARFSFLCSESLSLSAANVFLSPPLVEPELAA